MSDCLDIVVRNFRSEDVGQLADLFMLAVHVGAQDVYTKEQRDAWAPHRPNLNEWSDRLNNQVVFVAEQQGRIVGFMAMELAGKIDLAFVEPNAMGRGVASCLYKAILRKARSLDLSVLTTEASFLAKRFFEKHGWQIIRQQTIERQGIELTNFLMELSIHR